MAQLREKPELSFWQIWNMSFGFLGIQFGFALQNSNVSRIFQTLGADMSAMPLLWVAAPLTGLLVQPVVGHFSDKTWTRLGRRRPYFLWGAILTTAALILMPNSPGLWVAAGTLWILDASINVTMEPFRAFVGDMLPSKQRTIGYVTQTFFIGVGAVVASAMPYIFTNYFGVSNTASEGVIPDSVVYSFYCGAVVLFLAVGWTILRTKEYSPEEMANFAESSTAQAAIEQQTALTEGPVFSQTSALVWFSLGTVFCFTIWFGGWDPQLYILALGVAVFGLIQLYAARQEARNNDNGFVEACRNIMLMPKTMQRLSVVQFFSWFPLFAMWIYTTAAVTSHHYGSADPQSLAYNQGADWVGVLFAAYNGFSILAALLIPSFARWFGLKFTHQINLLLGALGLASIMFFTDPKILLVSMVGVGFAWASILSIPYAILSDAVPSNKMGIYMGVFNFFIVIPQLVAASILGLVLNYAFKGEAIYILGFGAVMWVFAAFTVFFVDYQD